LATFERRTDKNGVVISIRVKIRRKGFPSVSKTFDVHGSRQAEINSAKREAEAWARQIESEMDRGVFVSRVESEQTTLKECLERYLREVSPTKKSAGQERNKIGVILKHKLSLRYMASIRSTDIATYRDDRLMVVASATVIRELALISHVFNTARKEWGMDNLQNPVEAVRKPKLPQGRDRRLQSGELDAILKASESAQLQTIILLALESAMRRGELASLKWRNVFLSERYVVLADTKNGSSRKVPLSNKAASLLHELKQTMFDSNEVGDRVDGRVFLMRADSITQAFERARDRARKDYVFECARKKVNFDDGFLNNLRFHDLRHEATSHLFEIGLNPIEAASITGHKDIRMLMRYTHLRVEDLAKKLG
jgi:integrase